MARSSAMDSACLIPTVLFIIWVSSLSKRTRNIFWIYAILTTTRAGALQFVVDDSNPNIRYEGSWTVGAECRS
jgi:hypothetical protein